MGYEYMGDAESWNRALPPAKGHASLTVMLFFLVLGLLSFLFILNAHYKSNVLIKEK